MKHVANRCRAQSARDPVLAVLAMLARGLAWRACWVGKPEPSRTEYERAGVDTSKAVFTLHGVDQQSALFCVSTFAAPS
jgi:hypothetical protein